MSSPPGKEKEDDDGSPSDEEVSSSASEQIQQTPSNTEPDVEEFHNHNPATKPNDDGVETVESSAGPSYDCEEEEIPKPQSVHNRGESSGYESFAGKSKASSTTFFKEDTPDDEASLSRPKSRILASKISKGQVLVHYHPQLGDEGFESTLVNDAEDASLTSRSRGRPMDEQSYYSSGGAAGMNSRMMDDVRVGKASAHSVMNDGQNNAATRQIRRRVFRAALERGIHDERVKKMLDADADIGGPSLKAAKRRPSDIDDGNIPPITIKPSISSMTPRSSYEISPNVTPQHQTVSPPAPPVQPPSYRAVVQSLIKDNEPEKLPQLDKVLLKYKGREEELISKLDLRYKKRKQSNANAILVDLEKIQKDKVHVSLASKSGEEGRTTIGSKTSFEEHGGIKQMNSWGSNKSKDVYFVKVSEAPRPGAIKLPSDIVDSNKTAPHSNVRAALSMEDDGDIPAIPKCDSAPVDVAATVAANAAKIAQASLSIEQAGVKESKEDTISPLNLHEPYKLAMATSYGDGISVITMETKGTIRTKKNDRGEEVYSWLQRPPNSITVEGGSKGSKEDDISPLGHMRKINRLLPDFDQEKKDDEAKARDAKLESMALNNVEARIRARRQIMEAEVKTKAVSNEDIKTGSEKAGDIILKQVHGDEKASIIDDAESFVGKRKPTASASTQVDEVHPSLIDQQELLPQAAASEKDDDDSSEGEEIHLLLKESRLQAEKNIALKKAQRELEKEKQARLEAETARMQAEEELARLKLLHMADDLLPIALNIENAIGGDSDEDNVIDVTIDKEPSKYDLNNTFSSVSSEKSEQAEDVSDEVEKSRSGPKKEIGADQASFTGEEHLTALRNLVLDGGSDDMMEEEDVKDSSTQDAVAQESEHESSAQDKAFEATSPLGNDDLVSPPVDKVFMKTLGDQLENSLGATQTRGHDFPSTTMAHVSSSQAVLSEQKDGAKKDETDEDANIYHVATMTFEGNRAKGQLSFTTGSKVLAHSNQRGPWWLGRCGGRTGWFPANAVVPESEYLKNIAVAMPSEIDESYERLGELSNEELAATYDLIRNPSYPINDEENNNVDDDDDDGGPGSPARSRWLDDCSSKNAAQSSRSDSPLPTRLDPSEMEGLKERLYEPKHESGVDAIPQLGFEGMNRVGKSIEEQSEARPKKTYIGPPRVTDETDCVNKSLTDSPSKKKNKHQVEWKAALDPSTGLTYYYHIKSREVSYM